MHAAPTILIADDDPVTLALLTGRLRKAGYEVVQLEDAGRLVDDVLRHRPALILFDVTQPFGGFQGAALLKQLPALARIPLMFYTANRYAGYAEQAARIGAAGFFEKPVDVTQLLAAICRALEEGAATAAPMATPPLALA